MAVLLITHDMGVIAETAQRVIVMYAPRSWRRPRSGAVQEPLHPYTQGLLRSIPRIDLAATQRRRLPDDPGHRAHAARRGPAPAAVSRHAVSSPGRRTSTPTRR